MSSIVAARFTTQRAAEEAAARLLERGCAAEDINLFFVNPPGQHSRHSSWHAMHAAAPDAPPGHGRKIGAIAGAIAGAALGAIFGAVFYGLAGALGIVLCAAPVGAYCGALIGKPMHRSDFSRGHLHELQHEAVHHETRRSGMLVAVHASPETERSIGRMLADAGGLDVERASGHWQRGHWADFDPTRSPEPLDGADDFTHRPA